MVPRAMDKRGKGWTSLTDEQENTLVDLAVDQLLEKSFHFTSLNESTDHPELHL